MTVHKSIHQHELNGCLQLFTKSQVDPDWIQIFDHKGLQRHPICKVKGHCIHYVLVLEKIYVWSVNEHHKYYERLSPTKKHAAWCIFFTSLRNITASDNIHCLVYSVTLYNY